MNQLLELRNISKSFPGVKALDDIDLDLREGEVHVIVGENGAGKSTLMKIISGAYQSDTGIMTVEGEQVTKNSPIISEKLGIGMIYQELNLIPELSVAKNVFLGHLIKKFGINQDHQMNQETKKMLERLQVEVDPEQLVKNLGVGTQQMIEITKALSKEAKILVLDEPTSSLTDSEVKELFSVIRMLKARGIGMFYISHRLEEIFEIGDRITILRDGKKIRTSDIEDISMEEIIEGIAGRKIENIYQHTRKKPGEAMLEIRDLSGYQFRNINMKVHAGEIVGVYGLVGAGRTEVVRATFGIDKYFGGEVILRGKLLKENAPGESVKQGLCLIPENRKTEGLALERDITENIMIASLPKAFKFKLGGLGVINEDEEDKIVEEQISNLDIATPTAKKMVQFLSGGTQQKVVLAKWLVSNSEVFIFDEPTRGIDVGAKSEIYQLMDDLVNEGAGILMISSDLPEILGMSDRIYVMSQGNLQGEFDHDDAKQNSIMQYAFGQKEGKEKESNEEI